MFTTHKKCKIYITFDDKISNTKSKPVATELFIRGRKVNGTFAFITQSYFTNIESNYNKKRLSVFLLGKHLKHD